MIEVKVSTNFAHWPLARQTPRGAGEWGGCRFLVNQEVEACDFWVVLDGFGGPETVRCHPSNTLLVTCEPPDVKTYAPEFLRQFAVVLTSHRKLHHPHVLHGQQGLPWMIGARLEPASLTWTNFMSFEEIERYSVEKRRLLSIVASRDKVTRGHAARNRFIEELKRTLGDRVDVFGLGYMPIGDKLDAIGPYRYHVAIENSCVADYWTEKLADAYLGRAFPIYSGCPNLSAYFPTGSYEPIDIGDPAAAVQRVEEIISSNIDLNRRSKVLEARRRVLHAHNLFAVLATLIGDLRQTGHERPGPLTLRPESPAAQGTVSKRSPAMELLARYARRWRR